MKEIAQTFLIVGGGLGLFAAIPAAIYGWILHRGFGGDLTSDDRLMLYSPLICGAALTLGLLWRRSQAKKVQPRGFKLTEDSGASGDVGGHD